MSYVVLARKWRPMTFADLVGQEHVAKTLGNAIQLGRVAHAFLFTGVRGVGKTTSARILAKALNCATGPTVTPCLTCPQCLEIAQGTDLDVQEIDAASRTGVDDIRELQETLAYRPTRDRFKVFIVDEVHMLSNNAWNAFLKTLEEPPAHVKFIFATTEVNKVPVTILSRCQRYDFKLIDVATIQQRLSYVLQQEGLTAEEGALQILARESAGSMRDGMSLLDQVIAWSGGDAITTAAVARALGVAETAALMGLVRALVSGDAARCLEIVHELTDSGHDVAHLSRDILGLLRDLVVARVAPTSRGLLALPEAEVAELKTIAGEAPSADDLSRLHLVFAKATEEILESPLPRASLEMALVRVARRPPLLAIDDLLRRLGELEGRLEAARSGGGVRRDERARPRGKPAPSSGDPEPGDDFFQGPSYEQTVSAPARFEPAAPTFQAPPQPTFQAPPQPTFQAPPQPTFQAPPPRAAEAGPAPARPSFASEAAAFGTPMGTQPAVFTIPASVLAKANGQVESEDFDGPPPSSRAEPPRSKPPASHPAPAPRPATPSGPPPILDPNAPELLEYARFVDQLRQRNSRLSSLLERVALFAFDATRLAVHVDPQSFEGNLLFDADTRKTVEAALIDLHGPDAKFELVEGARDERAPTLALLANRASVARSSELDEKVRKHPLVAVLVSSLSAEIRDVRVVSEASTETLSEMLLRTREEAAKASGADGDGAAP